VTFKSKDRIVANHTFTIVRNLQQSSATSFDFYRDPRGACVNTVFDKLFRNRGGTFNDFTGCDLIGYVVCEDADF
jgi:hypothetical protein